MTIRRPRVIPCLLLLEAGLVKTVRFRDPTYLGDPINIVRIFNDKGVDELILLDIGASRNGTQPQFDLIARIAGECFMPLCYGGGVRSLEDMEKLYGLGVEKVALNSAWVERPGLLREASERFGCQSLVASIDVKRGWFGRHEVRTCGGRRRTALEPVTLARRAEDLGAGEVLLTSIDRDGTGTGYDVGLIRRVTDAVRIPVVACGGAGKLQDLAAAVRDGHAAAAAAGSLFVFQGKHRAVLISYPTEAELRQAL